MITRELLIDLLHQHQELQDHIRANKDPEAAAIDEATADRISLRVELGEFCNEGQWFKYWKRNREPVTERLLPSTYRDNEGHWKQHTRNPLLEEYVDVVSVLFSIGNNMAIEDDLPDVIVPNLYGLKGEDILSALDDAYFVFWRIRERGFWIRAFAHWMAVGELVGFSIHQIFEAYKDKRVENHKRQDTGY